MDNVITVSVVGSKVLEPNVIDVWVNHTAVGDTESTCEQKGKDDLADITKALESYGVDDYSIESSYVTEKGGAYLFDGTLKFRVHKSDGVIKFNDLMLELGKLDSHCYSIVMSYKVTGIMQYRNEMLKGLFAKARERADVIAKNIDADICGISRVRSSLDSEDEFECDSVPVVTYGENVSIPGTLERMTLTETLEVDFLY